MSETEPTHPNRFRRYVRRETLESRTVCLKFLIILRVGFVETSCGNACHLLGIAVSHEEGQLVPRSRRSNLSADCRGQI